MLLPLSRGFHFLLSSFQSNSEPPASREGPRSGSSGEAAREKNLLFRVWGTGTILTFILESDPRALIGRYFNDHVHTYVNQFDWLVSIQTSEDAAFLVERSTNKKAQNTLV